MSADDEQRFIKYVLAFFANSDGIVMENLAVQFMKGECPTRRNLWSPLTRHPTESSMVMPHEASRFDARLCKLTMMYM